MSAHRKRSELISEYLLQASRVFSSAVPKIDSFENLTARYSISTLRELAKIRIKLREI